jgi:hypothetical protein
LLVSSASAGDAARTTAPSTHFRSILIFASDIAHPVAAAPISDFAGEASEIAAPPN